MNEMDPRDVERAKYGYLPIFVHEPRPLTAEEVAALHSFERDIAVPSSDKLLLEYEPCVKDGYVFWRKREGVA